MKNFLELKHPNRTLAKNRKRTWKSITDNAHRRKRRDFNPPSKSQSFLRPRKETRRKKLDL